MRIRAIASVAFFLVVQAANAQLYVRGSTAADAREVSRITREGVVVGEHATELVPWYEVKDVRGEFEEEARPYLPIAERAWRAKSRLERHDYELAFRLFAALFEEYDTGDGPTSSMIAQGQLACTLERGRELDALAPFFGTLLGRQTDSIAPAFVRIDPETRLAPELPPFWIPPNIQRAAHAISTARPDESDADGSQFAIASMYLLLAIDPEQAARGERVAVVHDQQDPGHALLNALLISRIGSAEQRRESRMKLDGFIDDHRGTWMEAWCRIGIGRSLLRESDESDRRRAVIEFLHVPSHLDTSHYVTALSLAFACDALIELGEIEQAQRLARLLARYPSQQDTNEWIERRLGAAEQLITNEENE